MTAGEQTQDLECQSDNLTTGRPSWLSQQPQTKPTVSHRTYSQLHSASL